jgi:hypothetical protein
MAAMTGSADTAHQRSGNFPRRHLTAAAAAPAARTPKTASPKE